MNRFAFLGLSVFALALSFHCKSYAEDLEDELEVSKFEDVGVPGGTQNASEEHQIVDHSIGGEIDSTTPSQIMPEPPMQAPAPPVQTQAQSQAQAQAQEQPQAETQPKVEVPAQATIPEPPSAVASRFTGKGQKYNTVGADGPSKKQVKKPSKKKQVVAKSKLKNKKSKQKLVAKHGKLKKKSVKRNVANAAKAKNKKFAKNKARKNKKSKTL